MLAGLEWNRKEWKEYVKKRVRRHYNRYRKSSGVWRRRNGEEK